MPIFGDPYFFGIPIFWGADFWGVPRTLLALGCHVGMADEKAEENLKKIKLPKT